jgi:hypothetical protein
MDCHPRAILLIKAFHTLFAIFIYQLEIDRANEANPCKHDPRRLRLPGPVCDLLAAFLTGFHPAPASAVASH